MPACVAIGGLHVLLLAKEKAQNRKLGNFNRKLDKISENVKEICKSLRRFVTKFPNLQDNQ